MSSTFEDLKVERQAVLKAILELDQMPAGMELFPASDDGAWQLIRDVIDRSDYYVLIVGGRYGSLDEEGIGYTEREYDYAIAQRKPVIPLLHKNPGELPRDRTETSDEAWARLEAFREKIEQAHTCVYWEHADELKVHVILGLTSAMKRRPGIGWVRADEIPEHATPEAVLALKDRIAELEAAVEADRTTPPAGTEHLSQGDDTFPIKATVSVVPPGGNKWEADKYSLEISPSWNELFAAIAPTLINEAKEADVRQAMEKGLTSVATRAWRELEDPPEGRAIRVSFRADDVDTCFVQLRALGLIRESVRKRSVRDTATYWTLTPFGDHMLVKLRAIRRQPDGTTHGVGSVDGADLGDAGESA